MWRRHPILIRGLWSRNHRLWHDLLSYLELDPEPVGPALFLVHHVGDLPEPEYTRAPSPGVHPLVLAALGTEVPYGHILLRRAPYLYAAACLAQRPEAAVTFADSLALVACAAHCLFNSFRVHPNILVDGMPPWIANVMPPRISCFSFMLFVPYSNNQNLIARLIARPPYAFSP